MIPDRRSPAVAGFFYEADPAALRRSVERYLSPPPEGRVPEAGWRAILLPHAGHVYCGAIAGAAAAAVDWPSTAILLGPNHRGVGAAAALSPADAWRTPLGDVPVAARLNDELLAASPVFELDAGAHEGEHSLEVLLPFLQASRPGLEAVFLSLGEPDLDLCREAGRAVAGVVTKAAARGERIALVVSSDLNHYLPRAANRVKDDRAVDALLAGDPVELFTRVERERISMCGILPATALLEALRRLPPTAPALVARGDSADASDDTSRVVGYASIVWKEAP